MILIFLIHLFLLQDIDFLFYHLFLKKEMKLKTIKYLPYKDNKDDLYLSFNIYEKGDIVSFDYMNGDDLIYTHISGEFESITYTGLGYYNESNIITLKGGKKYLVNDIINLSCDKIK